MRDPKLRDLRVKCSNCAYLNTPDCRSIRCVNCVTNKNPDPGCGGIEQCREAQVDQLNSCTRFRQNQWDQ